MSKVIFARPRHNYASYADLYRLIEVSGYPLIHFDEIDPQSDNTYIMTVLNGENMYGWQQPRARLILYDLEWHLDGVNVPGVREVWAADRWYAGQIGAHYVPLGSDDRLRLDEPVADGKVYDVATLWYVTHRRGVILTKMRESGLRIAPVSDLHGLERHRVLSQSLMMVHVHQHDGIGTIAPQRFALAAAYKLPLLTEGLADAGVLFTSVVQADGFDIPTAAMFLADPQSATSLHQWAEILHQTLCIDYNFSKTIEANV